MWRPCSVPSGAPPTMAPMIARTGIGCSPLPAVGTTLGFVPAQRIAENLAFINWTVLAGLAIGSFAAVVLARLRTDATRGFLTFTAAASFVIGVLALLSDQALPSASP